MLWESTGGNPDGAGGCCWDVCACVWEPRVTRGDEGPRDAESLVWRARLLKTPAPRGAALRLYTLVRSMSLIFLTTPFR